MSSIKLRQVICPGFHLKESYDTLLVLEWEQYPWRKQDFNGLVCICRRLKIRRVVFMQPPEGDISDFALNNVLKWYDPNGCPFLPDLKVIQIQHHKCHVALATLARYSRVKELIWYIKSRSKQKMDMWIEHVFLPDGGKLMRHNHSIQGIKFLSDVSNPGQNQYHLIETDKLRFRDCSLWMENNAAGWRNCTKAILILIGLKKRGQNVCCLSRDTLNMIVQQVWETRGTKVWTE